MELSAAITAQDWVGFIQQKLLMVFTSLGGFYWMSTDRARHRSSKPHCCELGGLYGVSPVILGMVLGNLGCLSGQSCPKHQEG